MEYISVPNELIIAYLGLGAAGWTYIIHEGLKGTRLALSARRIISEVERGLSPREIPIEIEFLISDSYIHPVSNLMLGRENRKKLNDIIEERHKKFSA